MNTQILLPHQFPAFLREIPTCPKKLYIQGVLPPENVKYLCVVGSRKYSQYGADACRELITGLAGYNICIVSGLALGIDGIAHEAALAAGLHTIAFPGSGLNPDILYPERNHQLATRILEAGGALLSEFEMDFQATPWAFPQRNRLMAGIAHATLVVEAKERSGTLITSAYALDFNRDVFAVPGPIFSMLSYGPNTLIKDGAAIIRNSDDILFALGITKKMLAETAPPGGTSTLDEATPPSRKESFVSCTPEEKIVLDILAAPLQKDELIRQLESEQSMDVQDANILISMMELGGLIGEEGGMMFAKKITSM
jgi:DNA processing protein